jgi:hypothetical protein
VVELEFLGLVNQEKRGLRYGSVLEQIQCAEWTVLKGAEGPKKSIQL